MRVRGLGFRVVLSPLKPVIRVGYHTCTKDIPHPFRRTILIIQASKLGVGSPTPHEPDVEGCYLPLMNSDSHSGRQFRRQFFERISTVPNFSLGLVYYGLDKKFLEPR